MIWNEIGCVENIVVHRLYSAHALLSWLNYTSLVVQFFNASFCIVHSGWTREDEERERERFQTQREGGFRNWTSYATFKKNMALKKQYFVKFLKIIMCILHYWFILEQSSAPVINSLFVSHDYLTLLQHCLICISIFLFLCFGSCLQI